MEDGGCECDVRRRVERWYSIQRGTIDLTFSLYFDLNFLLFLLARALVYRHIAVLTLRRRRERVYP